MTAIRVGDPDPAPDYLGELCAHRWQAEGGIEWTCTVPAGHVTGQHAAVDGTGRVVAVSPARPPANPVAEVAAGEEHADPGDADLDVISLPIDVMADEALLALYAPDLEAWEAAMAEDWRALLRQIALEESAG